MSVSSLRSRVQPYTYSDRITLVSAPGCTKSTVREASIFLEDAGTDERTRRTRRPRCGLSDAHCTLSFPIVRAILGIDTPGRG
jgi:hypothetical protein